MRRTTGFWLGLAVAGTIAGCAPAPSGQSGQGDRFPVYFDDVSVQLTPAAHQVIDDAAGRALATRAAWVRIEGRASATGAPAANQKLSEQRVAAVAEALRKDGVDPTRFQEAYLGETGSGDPGVADRRVDIVLVH